MSKDGEGSTEAWAQTLPEMQQAGDSISSCALRPYFCGACPDRRARSYNMLKNRAAGGDPNYQLSPGSYLLCSAEASSHTLEVSPFLMS